MNLGKAFAAAFSFAAKQKDDLAEVLKCVMLYPDYRVVAQTDRVGIIQQADGLQALDGPVLLPVDELKPAVAKAPIVKVEQYPGWIRLWSAGNSWFDVPIRDPMGFPPVLEYPTHWMPVPKEDWKHTIGVVHAAAKPVKGRYDQLCSIQILENHILATDSGRVAVVFHGLPDFTGRVPAELFVKWPKGDVYVGRVRDQVWLRVGDQLRWGRILDGKYPDVSRYLEPTWGRPAAVVKTETFRAAVEHGAKVSRMKVMILEFGAQLTIRAYTGEAPDSTEAVKVTAYEASVPCSRYQSGTWPEEDAKVLLDVQYLLGVLKAVETPNVRLVFGQFRDPIYIESGWHTEVLCPRI